MQCKIPLQCQFPACQSSILLNEIIFYCVDCSFILCPSCIQSHDKNHCIIENPDLEKLQAKKKNPSPSITSINQPFENVSPISVLQSDSKSGEKSFLVNRELMEQLSLIEDESSQDSKIQVPVAKLKEPKILSDPYDDENDDYQIEDDDMMIKMSMADYNQKNSMNSYKTSSSSKYFENKSSISNNSSFRQAPIEMNSKENSNHFLESSQFTTSTYFNNQYRAESNSLQVPQTNLNFNQVKLQIYSNQFDSGYLNSKSNYFQPPSSITVQPQMTQVQELLKPLSRFTKLIEDLQITKQAPHNKINKKVAKTLFKKKRPFGGKEEDDNSMIEEDIPFPVIQLKEDYSKAIDNKTLADIKNKAKTVFEDIKQQSQILFKEIKGYIHGVQYERDEIERINKYKKFTIEGVEIYFKQLKEQFQSEFDKIKKCKKREKLSRMMNKIQKITDQYQYIKEPKDFISFLSKDYGAYFLQIQEQLIEIQLEGNDIPPQFFVVFENLYDIFDSLLNFISLHLPIKKEFKASAQPFIQIANSPHSFLPIHCPSKKKVGVWNCKSHQLIEYIYEGEGFCDFGKYKNFQIVCDSEYIYFIGGQIFNQEKNIFNPSAKSFKMSISSGLIVSLCDMPTAKMKFGIVLIGNFIYTFGGLQSSEKFRSNSCEFYNLSTNCWKQLPVMQKNRASPIVCSFMKEIEGKIVPHIYLFGGMEDKNNISYSIEVFNASSEQWIEFHEKPANNKCYIPKQLGYAIQINFEQILILGGMSGRKQKPTTSMQAYNISKNSISNLSMDSLPTGLLQDLYSGQPIIQNKSLFILNSQISQYFPVLKQLDSVFNILKIGHNQQEIIQTCCI